MKEKIVRGVVEIEGLSKPFFLVDLTAAEQFDRKNFAEWVDSSVTKWHVVGERQFGLPNLKCVIVGETMAVFLAAVNEGNGDISAVTHEQGARIVRNILLGGEVQYGGTMAVSIYKDAEAVELTNMNIFGISDTIWEGFGVSEEQQIENARKYSEVLGQMGIEVRL